jgi:uncharacterized Ntn-hydrolase superfamily protein
MRTFSLFTVILALMAGPVSAGQPSSHLAGVPKVTTFSIVAYDSATGQLGAAVQSHWFKVADVISVEAKVGAIASQSLADFTYGHLGLEMLKMGRSPEEALRGLIEADPNPAVRQVAIVDADGEWAVHTGDGCIAEAGDHCGEGYCVQANLMRNNTVWDAMAKAYETTQGDLAERMMAALEAAQAEGGDIRGKQSAAMVVVTGEPTGRPWEDRIVDIRVDDSPEPLKELRRLLEVTRAYDWMNRGDGFIAEEKFDEAAEAYAKASELAPDNMEIVFWHAATLAEVGQVERSLPLFKKCFAADKSWKELVPRLVKAELLSDDPAMLEKILAQ